MAAKSTGLRSVNSHAWGDSTTIAEQLTLPERPISARMVMDAMIRELVEEGEWPEFTHEWLRPGPMPWSIADSRLANVMVQKLHAFADLHGLYLIEYDDSIPPKPQKQWYGKPKGAV